MAVLMYKGKQVSLPSNQKERERIDIRGHYLVDESTGEILCENVTPQFENLTLDDYLSSNLLFLEAMSATEYLGGKLDKYLNDNSKLVFAEKKHDGHRALGHIKEDKIRLFSKRLVKSGWFGENTDTVPHIRDTKDGKRLKLLDGTVIDAEITTGEHSDYSEVQSITGSKPINSIYAQTTNVGLGILELFDIVYYKHVNVTQLPLVERKLLLFSVYLKLSNLCNEISFSTMYMTKQVLKSFKEEASRVNKYLEASELSTLLEKYVVVVDSYKDLFRSFTKEGYEGIMLKDAYSTYSFKATDAYVKMKGHTTYDVVLMGYLPPEKLYDGKSTTWDYWESGKGVKLQKTLALNVAKKLKYTPVTKFYFQGWIGSLIYGVYKKGRLVEVGRSSGLNDSDRAMFSANPSKYIHSVIEVEAQRMSDVEKGSLQHPRFIRIREDKNAEQCTWERHLL